MMAGGGVQCLDSIDDFILTLQQCRHEKVLGNAQTSHLHVCKWGLETHENLGNFLVPLFIDCGSVSDACRAFGKLSFHTEHSWTSLMQGFNGIDQWQNAMDLYQQMIDENVCPSKFTFMALLKACARLRHTRDGQDLHAEITIKGIENDPSVGNTLIDMYSKCGLLLDARKVFDDLHTRDIFSWGALATGYFYHGLPDESLECFNLMQRDGIRPNAITYICSLKACGSLSAIDMGHRLHSEISIDGYESVPSIASALVSMYAKCGSLIQAEDVFSEMSTRDVTLWNSLLVGYSEHGHPERALKCWEEMKLEGVVSSDAATFVGILKACIKSGAIENGQMLHVDCCLRGLETSPYIGSSLVEMYIKLGFLAEAQQVFDGMPLHDVVLWTGLITGYTEHGCNEDALDCLEKMQHQGVSPNSVTFVCALKACGSIEARHKGQEIHIEIVKRGFERDTAVFGSLVEVYAKWGSLFEAQSLFDGPQDVVSWNILIAGCVEHELYEEGLKYFEHMQIEQISPSVSTYVSTMKACGCLGDIQIGYNLNSDIIKRGMEGDAVIRNILVDLYVKCNSLAEAEDVLNRFPAQDAVAWTALIQGYVNHGLGKKALEYFERMKSKDVYPDIVTFVCGLQSCSCIGDIDKGLQIHIDMAKHGIDTDRLAGNSLVDMYAKLGLLEEASCVFEKVLTHDVVSWNTLIHGFAEQGMVEDAVNCFQQMQQEGLCPDEFSWSILVHGYMEQEETEEAFRIYAQMKEQGIEPNNSILANLLASCGSRAALQSGKILHSQIIGPYLVDAVEINLATNLIDMYGRCGSIEDSWQVFNSMKKKDLVAWNALSTGYARHGKSSHVFDLCSRMQEEGLQPNEITWLSLLSVCRHAGLVDKGQALFETMRKEAGIVPNMKHYSCTIDLLGRAGRLDEIVPLMEEMPFEPNLATWHTIMSACQKYGDVQLGRKAFACARSLGEKHAGTYVFMSNIFADNMIESDIY